MSKWSEIYKQQISVFPDLDSFIENRIKNKIELIDIVKKYSHTTKKILEVGSGSGITSIFLEQNGYTVTGIDTDPDMIELAASIAEKKKSSALFKIDTIEKLATLNDQHFDTIFSNGVMEHFSDADIINIINHHLLISDYVVVSIPSNYFSDDQRIYGDERFMSADIWRSIFSKTNGKILEEFNFNSDKNNVRELPQFIGFVLSSL